ncbi:hypothetical protein MRX96_006433 [Rhipicephalus microplus]
MIEQVEKGRKRVDVAVAYGLSKQTVNTILKSKATILSKKVLGDLQPKRFRLREASYPDVEETLLMWLPDARSRNIPVNGLSVRIRTEQLAFAFNQEQFHCSEGLKNYFTQKATGADDLNTLVTMEARTVSKAVCHTVQVKMTSFFQEI